MPNTNSRQPSRGRRTFSSAKPAGGRHPRSSASGPKSHSAHTGHSSHTSHRSHSDSPSHSRSHSDTKSQSRSHSSTSSHSRSHSDSPSHSRSHSSTTEHKSRSGFGGSSFRGQRSSGGSRPSFSRSGGSTGRSSSGGGRGGSRGGRKMPSFNPSQFINKNPVDVVTETYVPTHKFSDFGLDNRLVNTLRDLGLTIPSPIQDQVIPLILEGKDVVGLAETGTGKTAAFLLPLIEHSKKNGNDQTLILTPTRELALQVDAELKKLSKSFNFYSTVCVGGTNITPQIRSLRRKNHFVIGTPGRIMDLMERRHLRTDTFSAVVLDEADRMLDMGFINDMKDILSTIPETRQTLFFSATMDEKTKALVHDFMKQPVTVSVKKKDVTNNIAQDIVTYHHHDKYDTLVKLLGDTSMTRVLIFGAMKHSVEKLAKELTQSGVKSESIHGNKSHGQRQQALNKFKSGNARVLVATDVAARGIHVDQVSHVINYDLPNTFEDYVHRIGRTGRADNRGQALTFVPAEIVR